MESLLNRITIDVNINKGKPSIRNMRFTVAQMLELVASGMSFDDILTDYPYIEKSDITASLHYASFVMNSRNMVLIEDVA